MDRDAQIEALTEALSSVPGMRQAERAGLTIMVRKYWATDLVDNWGVSIDPSKATMEHVRVGPAVGNHGPRIAQEKPKASPPTPELERNATPEEARRVLGPMFAEMLGTTQPELAKRINAARTPEERQVLLAELQQKIPGPIWEAVQQFTAADPATLTDHPV